EVAAATIALPRRQSPRVRVQWPTSRSEPIEPGTLRASQEIASGDFSRKARGRMTAPHWLGASETTVSPFLTPRRSYANDVADDRRRLGAGNRAERTRAR